MDLIPFFLIGLVGSLHCIGMCGPIVLALPSNNTSVSNLFIGRALYNIGRILTYGLMGAAAGLFANKFILAGFQQYVSIILGAVIILYLILPAKIKAKFANNIIYTKISSLMKIFYSQLNSSKSVFAFLAFGLINGLLPCGLVYIALIGSFTANSVFHGFLSMIAFGLGTFPVMFVTSLMGKFITLNIRKKITKLVPYLSFLLAVLFILRGLNLGIPYISPNLEKMQIKTDEPLKDCCH